MPMANRGVEQVKRVFFAVLAVFGILVFVLAGCGGGGGGGGNVTNPTDSGGEDNPSNNPNVHIYLNTQYVTVNPGGTFQFSATVSNTENKALTWTVDEGSAGGSFSSTTQGLYTAPSAPGEYHIIATSVDNPTKTASTTVVVPDGRVYGGYKLINVWAPTYGDNDPVGNPTSIAVDDHGNVFILDTSWPALLQYSPNGDLILFRSCSNGYVGGAIDADTSYITLICGNHIAYYSHESCNHVAEQGMVFDGVDVAANYSLNLYTDRTGIQQGVIICNQTSYPFERDKLGRYQFFATGVATDPGGIGIDAAEQYLYVTDRSSKCITRIRIQDYAKTTFDVSSSGIQDPRGVDVDSKGNIYVVDSMGNCIYVFSSSGSLVTKFGSEGNGPGQFESPRYVKVAPDDSVYVLDTGNRRVQKFRRAGI